MQINKISGFVASETLESILEHVDLVLYDIKAIDAELHKKLTGIKRRSSG